MFEIDLGGFRVFESTPRVAIRPITIITGGNSSGKTSFLAAIRMLSDLSNWDSTPASFNKDPFFLGSFDQIAHHRGGRYGRNKVISLGITGTPGANGHRYYHGPRDTPLPTSANVAYSYRNNMGQPAISCMHTMTAKVALNSSTLITGKARI